MCGIYYLQLFYLMLLLLLLYNHLKITHLYELCTKINFPSPQHSHIAQPWKFSE